MTDIQTAGQLKGYVQHKAGCESLTMLTGTPDFGGELRFIGQAPCTCGLSALLAALEGTTARPEAMSEQAEAERNALALEVATLRERVGGAEAALESLRQHILRYQS